MSFWPIRSFIHETKRIPPTASLGRVRGVRPGGLVRPPHALGAAHLRRRRSRPATTPSSGSTTSSAPTPTPPVSAPAAASPSIRRKFRCTTAATGWATPIRSASWSPAAASSAWSSSPAPIRTPSTRTCTTRTRTGSPSTRRARSAATGRSPDLWVTCALGPYNFEFMTEVTREIVVHATRSMASSATAGPAPACATASIAATNFKAAIGHGSAPHQQSAGPARAAHYILWQQQRLFELWRLWDGEIRKINPDGPLSSPTPAAAR